MDKKDAIILIGVLLIGYLIGNFLPFNSKEPEVYTPAIDSARVVALINERNMVISRLKQVETTIANYKKLDSITNRKIKLKYITIYEEISKADSTKFSVPSETFELFTNNRKIKLERD